MRSRSRRTGLRGDRGGRMRGRSVVLVTIIVGSALACGGVEPRPVPDAAPPAPVSTAPPVEPPQPAVTPAPVHVEELEYAWTSAVRRDDGKYRIETSALRGRERGDRVTVLPLGVDAAPFVLPVADIRSEEGCGDVPETVVELK